MRSLPAPDRKDGLGFRHVCRYYSDLAPRARDVVKAYRDYIVSCAQGVVPIGLCKRDKELMELAYSSKAKAAGLDWINRLHDGHDLNFCPLCGGPGCRTIDHHLPDASYPEFSVFSRNLVPSCSSCNPKRNNSNQHGAALLTLSPYFDHAALDCIRLYTEIQPPYSDPTFGYKVKLQPFNAALSARINNHLATCIDDAAFVTWTKGQWSDMYSQRASRHSTVGSFVAELTDNLNAEVQLGNGNSWNASLVRGLLRNPEAAKWMIDNPVLLAALSATELGLD